MRKMENEENLGKRFGQNLTRKLYYTLELRFTTNLTLRNTNNNTTTYTIIKNIAGFS
jgi:hypothetical protein